jgi:hypothetical protein
VINLGHDQVRHFLLPLSLLAEHWAACHDLQTFIIAFDVTVSGLVSPYFSGEEAISFLFFP